MSIKVLCVCREVLHNINRHNYSVAEFIYEQNQHLTKLNVEVDYYLIKGGGISGYLNEISKLKDYLNSALNKYDIIHAHGGHIGFIANFQRKIPVVTTYHGSDINYFTNRLVSIISILFSRMNIFVSKKLFDKVKWNFNASIVPCGVDLELFIPLEKEYCRRELGYDSDEKIILFAGNQDVKVKNFALAESAIKQIGKDVKLVELRNFNRNQMNLLLNAADLLLLTSFSEGSPQIIKEALACNCPIVATDVGDIKEMISEIDGCYITNFNKEEVVDNIRLALQFNRRTNGREAVTQLDNSLIARKILEIYYRILSNQSGNN